MGCPACAGSHEISECLNKRGNQKYFHYESLRNRFAKDVSFNYKRDFHQYQEPEIKPKEKPIKKKQKPIYTELPSKRKKFEKPENSHFRFGEPGDPNFKSKSSSYDHRKDLQLNIDSKSSSKGFKTYTYESSDTSDSPFYSKSSKKFWKKNRPKKVKSKHRF